MIVKEPVRTASTGPTMKAEHLRVKWFDGGHEPTQKPDPAFPRGTDYDISEGAQSCVTGLPYPAKRIGRFLIHCRVCNYRMIISTAGRPADPRLIRVPCSAMAGNA